MNTPKNIEIYVDDLLEEIDSYQDPVKHFNEIEQYRLEIIKNIGLDINTVRTQEIVDALNKSKYQYLYQNVVLNDLADTIFLDKYNAASMIHKIGFQQMLQGITKDGINGVYNHESYPEFNDHIHGITLSHVEKYFVTKEANKLAELKGNVATFIEYFYNTSAGKAFIDSFSKIKDPKLQDEFFDKFFDEMNKASLIPRIGKKGPDGKRNFNTGGNGELDGHFILVDHDFNMSFSISTTISRTMSLEKDSVLRHAVTSKFIATAISDRIDDEIQQNKLNLDYLGENYLLKKDRATIWTDNTGTLKDKYSFIHNALVKKIEKLGLDLEITTTYEKLEIESGESTKNIIKELNAMVSSPAFIINTVLGEHGTITKEKIKQFFDMHKNFNPHFICNTPDVQANSEFLKSTLKEKMDAIDMKITDVRGFLQINSLKDGFLTKNVDTPTLVGFDKEAIDYFFNEILIRRIFNKPSQEKINQPNYLIEMENLIFNEFILAPDDVIKTNCSYLNEQDEDHFHHYLTFLVGDINGKERIIQKLKNLEIDSSYDEVLSKLSMNYPKIFLGTQILQKLEETEKERDSLKSSRDDDIKKAVQKANDEYNENARKYFIDNGLEIPEMFKVKKISENDEVDYTSGQKEVLDLGTSSTKSTHKNVTSPTIKKKLN